MLIKGDLALDRAAMAKYISDLHGDNSEFRKAFRIAFFKAMRDSLTERQYNCMIEYYINGKKEKEIAEEWGVSISCISRHLKRGRKRLRILLSYNLHFQSQYVNPDSVN